jgi:vacuolar-type H+-ATPase subunit H
MSGHPSPPAPGNVAYDESLRRVKAVEEDVEQRLGTLRSEGAARIQKLKEEADAAVLAARNEGQAAREAALADARGKAEAEAATLLAEGRKAAQEIEMKAAQTVAARRDAVLSVVVGEFRSTKGSS